MENKVKIFESTEFGSVRTIEINGVPYFVGKDVATILAYKDTSDALKRHVDDEDKKLVKVGEIPTLELTSNYGAYIINESGVYSLIFRSKLPNAKKFKRWVTSEVLPSLRQTGTYTIPQTDQQKQSVTATEYLEITKSIADWLKVNDASKITMLKTALSNYNLPTNILPVYTQSKDELLSCTTCLQLIGAETTAKTFNLLLIKYGYLEEKERPSNRTKSGIKKYKMLTEKGLEFGENQVCPSNPRETQPLYYVDKFQKLHDEIINKTCFKKIYDEE